MDDVGRSGLPRAIADSTGAILNVHAVMKATGLGPDTLRAWERRYGLPRPKRTPGGHRLYSSRDVETLRWLIDRQREGLSISRAVDLWRQLVAEGRDPVRGSPGAAVSWPTPEGSAPADLRREWLASVLGFDEASAEAVVSRAFALYPTETVCVEILQRALSDLGERWYSGEVSAQQEHFGSELAVRQVARLIAAAPAPLRPGRVVLACAPGEAHTFGPQLLALLLRRRGWDVVHLGASVPLERLDEAVAQLRPVLAVLSAQRLVTAAALLEAAWLLRALDVRVSYGGLIFNRAPSLRERIPAHFLSESLAAAPAAVERLLATESAPPPGEPLSGRFSDALAQVRQRQGAIAVEASALLQGSGVPDPHLTIAGAELSANLEAALAFGDLSLLEGELVWVEGLLSRRGVPPESLGRYLLAYHQAARRHLDERAGPVLEWLARRVGEVPA